MPPLTLGWTGGTSYLVPFPHPTTVNSRREPSTSPLQRVKFALALFSWYMLFSDLEKCPFLGVPHSPEYILSSCTVDGKELKFRRTRVHSWKPLQMRGWEQKPKVKYGVRSPKLILAPVCSCCYWLRPRNSHHLPAFGLMFEGAIGQLR